MPSALSTDGAEHSDDTNRRRLATQPEPSIFFNRTPWAWVPSLYFAEGAPYVLVMTVSGIMYKRLGISNTDIALYTSWLYLPWVLKPLWSPIVDLIGTKRLWTIVMQGLIGAVLAMMALAIPAPRFFQYTLALFWLMAFSSATHDVAADGLYMLGLKQHEQAAFAGVLAMFYRLAMIAGEGGLVILAGKLEDRFGSLHQAWEVTMFVAAGVMLALSIYHLVMLPQPTEDTRRARSSGQNLVREFLRVFVEFFKKDHIAATLAFLLLYRLGEAQLLKLIYPFLLDARSKGGLGLDTTQVGYIKGTVGIAALLCGGVLGGLAISKQGLRFWLWPMVFAMHLPDLAFVYLAYAKPDSNAIISAAVASEQFGFGFGFAAYTMFMIMVSQGEHKTSHYAICTGFMALGMMLPGMFSGWLQERVGYQYFFLCVMISTIPGFIVAALVRIPPDFGKKLPTAAA